MNAVATADQGRSQNWKAYAVLGAGILCIAWSAILVKVADDVSGPASAFYRVFIACTVLLPFWAVKSRGKPLPDRQTIGLAALGGLFFAFDLALFSSAILITSATSTTLIANSTPIWVALGSWLLWKELPSVSFWIGLGVILVGMMALVGGDVLSQSALGYGHLMAVASSAWYAAYIMTTHRVRATSDTLTFTVISVTASAVTLGLVCLVSGVPMGGFAPTSWAALVALGLVAQLGGYLAITYALGHLRASVTSVSLLAQAPLTALLAMPLLGERLSPAQAVGGALVLGGVYVVNRRAA